MLEFYMILARKIIKYPNFYDICPKKFQNSRIFLDFARKMPEYYIIIAWKIFFPQILEEHVAALPPVSYAYENSTCKHYNNIYIQE